MPHKPDSAAKGCTTPLSALQTSGETQPRTGVEAPALDQVRDSGAALRSFFGIVRDWNVAPEAAMALLGAPKATYYKWKRTPDSARLSRDQFERLSYVFGIYKALQILLPSPENADSWVNRPNDSPLFHGRPPLEAMSAGNVADLYRVRQLLDAERGW